MDANPWEYRIEEDHDYHKDEERLCLVYSHLLMPNVDSETARGHHHSIFVLWHH